MCVCVCVCARLQECEHQGEDGEGSDLGHCRSGAVPRHHERVSWHHSDLFHAWQALQALVMDTLPPATAMIDSTIGLEKLPANGHFFVGGRRFATVISN